MKALKRLLPLLAFVIAILALIVFTPSANACDQFGFSSGFSTFGTTTFVPTGVAPGVFFNQPVFVPTAFNPFGANVFVAGGRRFHGGTAFINGVPVNTGGNVTVRTGPFGGQVIRFRR